MWQKRWRFAPLLDVAAMMLCHPAGESFDEFSFSSAGGTLTKLRNSMGPLRVEQCTVIRMYIRQFGWSLKQVQDYITMAIEKADIVE